jgi:Fic family protein
LDEYFEADRRQYYQKIQQARDLDGDLTHWLEYVAAGVVRALRATKQRIESLRLAWPDGKIHLTPRQEDVIRYLQEHGRVKSPDLERAFRITRARVGQILQPLVKAGLILREGQTRSTSYRLDSGRAGRR